MSLTIVVEPVPLAVDRDGVARVSGTRVTLDTVVTAFLRGATPEEIAHQYPSLDLGDVYAVITYYLRRRDEVDSYMSERQRKAQEVRSRNEARFDPAGVRARLLARKPQGA
jgi:uncharacterized protein (DUF433 family)